MKQAHARPVKHQRIDLRTRLVLGTATAILVALVTAIFFVGRPATTA